MRTSRPDKEYLPITGLPEFVKNAALLAYGAESKALENGAVCSSIQRNNFHGLMSPRFLPHNLFPALVPSGLVVHFSPDITLMPRPFTFLSQHGVITSLSSVTLVWKSKTIVIMTRIAWASTLKV